MRRRVVITGLGVISPVGIGKDIFWENIKKGKSGISRISKFSVDDFPTKIAGEVKDFNPEDFIDKREARRLDRFSQFAIAATKLALEDSGWNPTEEEKENTAVIVTSGIGGFETLENQFRTLFEKGPNRISPFLIPMVIINIASGNISIFFGFKGPNYSPVSACASSAHAIGIGYRLVSSGEADFAIVGGSEASITPMGIAGFCALQALSTRNDEPEKASRPFDAKRDGFVMGEGAGILILEELNHALDRGARIYAEIVGFGASDDAYHITAPDPEGNGAVLSMKRAIKDANIRPEEINYINAHGTSTKLNDKIETLAIKKVFGEYAYKIPVSSTKSMIGHLLGAAASVESIATVLSIYEGILHPTINYEEKDPECDLDYVPNVARKWDVKYALKNSFGFGGQNATLIFKKYEDGKKE
ncbi:beta-ketoacyl-ACP synthase II [Dictyoglomus thermophilum]|uniref:3-oxoacyl-[acyl-carrier-protein] synthase 2 n=1 Tax=Dictyoglomus thermophilum (strain ATCC 35947 / DSM 3960 / H-6-12) TaxID=309799 RepID=B5YDQ4_DICT6|nr:beta-ketoacyl-ACP synthase II [Dictyoglomus thermophilum]ACI20145.1 3-oxoacyl-[acyl-carrier-protein] synthase II [Dictyoglomus thermophilum H-6-12]